MTKLTAKLILHGLFSPQVVDSRVCLTTFDFQGYFHEKFKRHFDAEAEVVALRSGLLTTKQDEELLSLGLHWHFLQ
ncbi:hypothetical protein BKA61DRAFT_200383 [Leptodontidium sp. MPI-SDFR-AT-0119]|nr:hypothetical protein BKA61DRAFT_200383 [Leptodontidium sp. MPI-SDFR-AT-0119]